MENLDFESVRNYCLSKSNTEECTPFGPEALVYKVQEKMFALLTFNGEEVRINLKNTPENNIELREEYAFITPGYHMNKKHWNTVSIKGFIDQKLISRLIDESYDLVVSSLPKKKRAELQKENYK